jgi:hypothetical protein
MQILRGLSSKILPCRCLVGVYETYDGDVVGILDAKSGMCSVAAHENGKQVPEATDTELSAAAGDSLDGGHTPPHL